MSKKRVRLNKEEEIALGLEVKKTEQGRNTFRAYIDIESQQKLNQVRHQGVYEYCKERGIDFNSVSQYWDKTKEYSVQVRPTIVS